MDYFRKQQWIRVWICIAALIVITLCLTGVIGGKPLTYRLPKDGEDGMRGDYTAGRETNFSTIEVTADVEDGKIVRARITSEAKSEGSDFLTDEIRKAWADEIVANQTAETDAITGATLQFSSGAVREATAEILEKAGIAPAATAEPEPEATAEPEPEATAEPEPEATAEPEPEATAEPEPEATAEPEPAAPAEEKKPAAYAAYLAVKETNFSTIRVILSTRNGEITGCRISSEEKMDGSDFLTDEIRKAWADEIIVNQTAETDAITGATLQFSSGAVREAVKEILEKAGK